MKHWIFILGILFTLGLKAQSLQLEASVDTNLGVIGEQIKLKLRVLSPKSKSIHWPSFNDSIGSLEILEQKTIDTLNKGHMIEYQQEFILTSFDSGYYTIPNIEIGIDEGKAFTNELVVRYNTLEVNPQKVMDIKQPKTVPPNYWNYVLWALLILVAAGLIIWLIKKYAKKSDKEEFKAPEPLIPPHEEALMALEKLLGEKQWEIIDQNKAVFTQLTDTVRRYLERRYGISTFEKTSSEIIAGMKPLGFSGDHKTKIEQLLQHADLIKFAKGSSNPHENEAYIQAMIQFVKSTIPVIQEQDAE